MYISIKLPASFGAFNQLRKENYPFNALFTNYLAAVCRLGLKLQTDVDGLVGFIEDRVFDGERLPDVPDGNEPVNIRYKTEDPDVLKYIGASALTNRNAVMYIARMTLRLSAAYGTSLLRLTKVINDLDPSEQVKKPAREQAPKETPKPKPKPKTEAGPKAETQAKPKEESQMVETQMVETPMPRVSSRAAQDPAPAPESEAPQKNASAEAARAALGELAELVEEAQPDDAPVVETNPYLNNFL